MLVPSQRTPVSIESGFVATQPSLWQRFKSRILDNRVKELYQGNDLDFVHLDNAVNAMALVDALMLGIPYTLIGNLDTDYWDRLDMMSADCPEWGYSTANDRMTRDLMASITCAVGALLIASFYHVFRPKNITLWWPKGRWVFALMFLLTVGTVIAVLFLSYDFMSYSNTSSRKYCTQSSETAVATSTGFLILVALFSIAIFF